MKNPFYLIKEVEENIANLYFNLSKKTKELYPDVSALFYELYKDEIHHSSQVDFVKNIFAESETAFAEDSKNTEKIELSLKFIKEVSKTINEKELKLHPVELLKISKELEEEIEKGHQLLANNISDENLRKLIESMIFEDRAHTKRISDFLENYDNSLVGLEDILEDAQ